jgi:hypothetical protein
MTIAKMEKEVEPDAMEEALEARVCPPEEIRTRVHTIASHEPVGGESVSAVAGLRLWLWLWLWLWLASHRTTCGPCSGFTGQYCHVPPSALTRPVCWCDAAPASGGHGRRCALTHARVDVPRILPSHPCRPAPVARGTATSAL